MFVRHTHYRFYRLTGGWTFLRVLYGSKIVKGVGRMRIQGISKTAFFPRAA